MGVDYYMCDCGKVTHDHAGNEAFELRDGTRIETCASCVDDVRASLRVCKPTPPRWCTAIHRASGTRHAFETLAKLEAFLRAHGDDDGAAFQLGFYNNTHGGTWPDALRGAWLGDAALMAATTAADVERVAAELTTPLQTYVGHRGVGAYMTARTRGFRREMRPERVTLNAGPRGAAQFLAFVRDVGRRAGVDSDVTPWLATSINSDVHELLEQTNDEDQEALQRWCLPDQDACHQTCESLHDLQATLASSDTYGITEAVWRRKHTRADRIGAALAECERTDELATLLISLKRKAEDDLDEWREAKRRALEETYDAQAAIDSSQDDENEGEGKEEESARKGKEEESEGRGEDKEEEEETKKEETPNGNTTDA